MYLAPPRKEDAGLLEAATLEEFQESRLQAWDTHLAKRMEEVAVKRQQDIDKAMKRERKSLEELAKWRKEVEVALREEIARPVEGTIMVIEWDPYRRFKHVHYEGNSKLEAAKIVMTTAPVCPERAIFTSLFIYEMMPNGELRGIGI